jgi:hypothetical protein
LTPLPNISDSTLARRRRVRDGRIFALTLAAGFTFVALLAMRKGRSATALTFLALAVASVLAALLVPDRLEPIRMAWMKLGEAIGYVTTPIFMMLIYFVFVTPIAIIRRNTSRRRPASDSNWHRRPPAPPPQQMERQF